MKRVVFGATVLAIGLTAVGVRALDNVALRGSDTMESILYDVLAACPGATSRGITFIGGGSSPGAQAMVNGTQTVAPMTRRPNDAETCAVEGGEDAEALVVALQAGAVVSGRLDAEACGSLLAGLAYSPTRSFPVVDGNGDPVIDCPGCEPGTNRYVIASWRDVPALIYGGVHHSGAIDCDSAVRRSLVASWGNLFEQACAGAPCPQGLRRAFRRTDLSGSTDTFTSLVGLSTVPLAPNVPGAVAKPNPFCNAHGMGPVFGGVADYIDQDPIRTPCGDDDQVCGHTAPGRTGTLGLVLPIEVPVNLTAAQNYPTRLCDFGKFRLAAPAFFGGPSLCPNGLPKLFNKCFVPVIENPDGTVDGRCIARRFPVQGIGGNGMDGRTYNLYSRNADMTLQRDNLNRHITGAFYRLHTTRTRVPSLPCTSLTSSNQIACLTVAHGCSLGLAELAAADAVPGAMALRLNGIPAGPGPIEAIVMTPGLDDDYPLARPLYFSTLRGFEDPNLQTGEYELAKCMGKSSLVAPIVEARGFFPVPAGVRCVDLASDTCPASASDACANNPAGLLSP